jgi:hypothetical protein
MWISRNTTSFGGQRRIRTQDESLLSENRQKNECVFIPEGKGL